MAKYLPEVYDKQSKIQFFYNEFKRRDANPEGFDNKMKNWCSSINKYCDDEDRFLVDLNELRQKFEYLSCRPHVNCLKLVLTNMIKERKLLPVEEFEREFLSNQNGSWLNWSVSSVKKTLGWFSSSMTAAANYVEQIDDQLNEGVRLVNVNVFDRIARRVLSYVRENNLFGRILKYNEFEENVCSKLELDKRQLEMIIRFLESKSNCQIAESNVKIIKFDEGNATITDKELSLRRLEDAKVVIEQDMVKLEEEVERCKEEAREAIKQNNKSKCMNILKKKARLSQQLEHKLNQFDNIEVLEDQLLNSDTNKQILEALAKSSQALKAKQPSADHVDDLLISIEDAMESQKSLLHDISRPIGGQVFDEDELELELNQLIEEDEIEKIAVSSKAAPDTSKVATRSKGDAKVPATNSQPANSPEAEDSESDELFERLRRLKGPPTTTPTLNPTAAKREKVRYGLLDDDF